MPIDTDYLGPILGQSHFGLNDNPDSYDDDLTIGESSTFKRRSRRAKTGKKKVDSQAYQYNKLRFELDQAYANGLVTHKQYAEIQRKDVDDRNWLQKIIFDTPSHVADAIGFDIKDQQGNFKEDPDAFKASGSTLETIFDILSLPIYGFTALSSGVLQGSKDASNNRYIIDAVKDGKFNPEALFSGTINLTSSQDENGISIGDFHTGAGIFTVGFSPKAFVESWRNRKEYISFTQETGMIGDGDSLAKSFAVGLALDVALDPLTYLTFGYGGGAKAAATTATRGAALKGTKLAAHTGTLTQTRLGRQVFNVAAEKVLKGIGKGKTPGNPGGLILNSAEASAMHQNIIEEMIKGFDKHIVEVYKRQRQGKLTRLSQMFPGSQANRSVIREAGLFKGTVDDMFQETASVLTKDRGLVNTEKAMKFLGGFNGDAVKGVTIPGLKYGQMGFKALFNTFDTNWDKPAELVQQARIIEGVARKELATHTKRYQSVFDGFTKAEREDVSRLTEQLEIFEKTGEANLAMAAKPSEKIYKAAQFIRTEMKQIADAEQAMGLSFDTVEDYISHIYTDPRMAKVARNALHANGEVNIKSTNSFTQHRLISSIGMAEELYGKGALDLDAYSILAKRRSASIAAVKKHEVSKIIASEYGLAEVLMSQAKSGILSSGVIRGLARRAGYGTDKIIDVDQIYKTESGILKNLGFQEGNFEHNRDLLKYLGMDSSDTGRFGPEGLALKESLKINDEAMMFGVESISRFKAGGIATDVERITLKPLPKEFKFSLRKRNLYPKAEKVPQPKGRLAYDPNVKGKAFEGGHVPSHMVDDDIIEMLPLSTGKKFVQGEQKALPREKGAFRITDAMDMLDDASHPSWDVIARTADMSKPSLVGIKDWLKGMNSYFKNNLGVHLGAAIPDLDERIIGAVLNQVDNSTIVRGIDEEGLAVKVREMLDEMHLSDPIHNQAIVPQLPQVVADFAAASKKAAGVITHEVPATQFSTLQMKKYATRVGFTPEMLKQYQKHMFGHMNPMKEGEVNLITQSLLDLLKQDDIVKSAGRIPLEHRGTGKVIKKTFTFNRMVKNNPINEIFDQNLGIPAKEGFVNPESSLAQAMIKGPAELEDAPRLGLNVADSSFGSLGSGKRANQKVIDEAVNKFDLQKGRIDEVNSVIAQLDDVAHSKHKDIKIIMDRKSNIDAALNVVSKILKREPVPPGLMAKAERIINEYQPLIQAKFKIAEGFFPVGKDGKPMHFNMGQFDKMYKGTRYSSREALQLQRFGEVLKKAFRTDSTELRNTLNTPANARAVVRLQKAGAKKAKLQKVVTSLEKELKKTQKEISDIMDFVEFPTAAESRSGLLSGHEAVAKELSPSTRVSNARNKYASIRRQLNFTPSDNLVAAQRAVNEARTKVSEAVNGVRAAGDDVVESSRWQSKVQAHNAELNDATNRLSQLRKAEMPKQLLDAQLELDLARINMEGWVTKGSPIDDALHGKYNGGLRPDPSKINVDVFLPEPVARMADELLASNISPEWSEWFVKTVLAFDKVQKVYKTHLLLPWAGTWSRNAISGTAMAYFAGAAQLLSPKGGFRNMKDYSTLMNYVLGSSTDLGKLIAPGEKLAPSLKKWGEHMIELPATKEMISVKDLCEMMEINGVFHGQISEEILSSTMKQSRFLSGVSGAAAGMTVGGITGGIGSAIADPENAKEALAGGAIGAAAGFLGGAKLGSMAAKIGAGSTKKGAIAGAAAAGLVGANIGASQGEGEVSQGAINWGSGMGAVMGALLGGRNISGKAAKVWKGGIPVPTADRVTGVLQSQYAPFMRAGEAATDLPARVAVYMTKLIENSNPAEASEHMIRYMNDWTSMSVFERRIMRRVVPFYGWTKIATKSTFNAATESPAKLNLPMKSIFGYNNAQDADPEDVPDFFHERLVLIKNHSFREDQKEIVSGFGLPIEDVASILTAIPTSFDLEQAKELNRGIFTRTAFGVTSLLEGAFNSDSFTQREIMSDSKVSYYARGDKWDTSPGWLKKLVGYRKATPNSVAVVDARLAWILGETPVSRFIDVAKRIFDMDEEGHIKLDLNEQSRLILGLSAYSIDKETDKYFVNKGKIDALAQLLSEIGAIKKFEAYYDVNKKDASYSSGRQSYSRSSRSRRVR